MKQIILLCIGMLFSANIYAGEFAVIVNAASSVKNMDAGEIKNLYLFEKQKIGEAVLKISDNKGNAELMKGFIKSILSMDGSEYDRKRVEITYAKGRSSKVLSTDSEVIAFVKEREGNIGYISKSSVTSDVVSIFSGSF